MKRVVSGDTGILKKLDMSDSTSMELEVYCHESYINSY